MCLLSVGQWVRISGSADLRRIVGRVVRFTSVVVALVIATVGLSGTTASASVRPNGIVPGRCTFTSAQPQLGLGSTGIPVIQAQCELNYAWAYNNLGHGGIAEDGIFGQATLNAVKGYQRCVHITADGIIGPVTWGNLNLTAGFPEGCIG
jgi:lysozyme